MFEFLKNIFKKEQPREKEEIGLQEVEAKFEQISKQVVEEANAKLGALRDSVKETVIAAKEAIEILKKAELRNPNIPVRAKHFMEGNRQTYIKFVEQFLEQVEFPEDILKCADFCEEFEKRLGELGKSTTRPYAILQEFFANESGNIAMKINNISKKEQELSRLIKESNTGKISEVRKKIVSINNRIAKGKELRASLDETKKSLEKNGARKSEIEEEERRLKEGDRFKRFSQLKEQLKAVQEKKKDKDNVLVQIFSVLEAGIKKFSRVTMDKEDILNRYLASPAVALEDDKELKIFDALQEMKDSIEKGSTELKDKKRKKTLEMIEQCSRDFFQSSAEAIGKLEEEQEKLDGELKGTGIHESMKSLEHQKEQNSVQIRIFENKRDYLLGQMDETSIDKLKQGLQEDMTAMSEKDIVIS